MKLRISNKFFLLVLISIIICFYFFFLLQNKNKIIVSQTELKKKIGTKSQNSTTFLNFKHVYINTDGKEFVTTGGKAYFDNNNNNLINLLDVHSFTKNKKGFILDIKSNTAFYNKIENNIFYKGNVIIKYKDGIIYTDNANYYQNKNIIELIDNVIVQNNKMEVKSDKAVLNTINKNIDLTMNEKNKKIYGIQKK